MHYIAILLPLLPSTVLSAPHTSLPIPLGTRDTGSSTAPYCMYNYNDNTKGAGQCPDENWGSPNPSYCQQSINFVCYALAQPAAVNNSIWGYQTGTGAIDGTNADCYAGGQVGEGATGPLDFNTCMQTFAGMQGCAETTNKNYNAACTGATFNLQFNTNNGHAGQPVDTKQPSFALATPKFFGVDQSHESFNHPDPQLAADTTDQSVQNAQAAAATSGEGEGETGATAAKPNAGVNEDEGSARAVVAVGFGVPSDGE